LRAFVALLVLSLVACGKHTKQAPVVAALEKLAAAPSKVVLYSLNPENHHDNDPYTDTVFTAMIFSAKPRLPTEASSERSCKRSLIGASENDDHAMACFDPRHALHIEQNGRSIDFTICFECLQVETRGSIRAVFSPASHQSRHLMSRSEAIICHLHPKKV